MTLNSRWDIVLVRWSARGSGSWRGRVLQKQGVFEGLYRGCIIIVRGNTTAKLIRNLDYEFRYNLNLYDGFKKKFTKGMEGV